MSTAEKIVIWNALKLLYTAVEVAICTYAIILLAAWGYAAWCSRDE